MLILTRSTRALRPTPYSFCEVGPRAQRVGQTPLPPTLAHASLRRRDYAADAGTSDTPFAEGIRFITAHSSRTGPRCHNGCPDRVADLCALVQSYGLHQGTTNSLCAKASAAASEPSAATAGNILGAFIHEVEAQTGKKIPNGVAEVLVAFANTAITLL